MSPQFPKTLLLSAAAAVLLLPLAARAGEAPPSAAPQAATAPQAPAPAPPADPAAPGELPTLEAHADLQNLVRWRNDTDFDRTPPLWNAYGQSVGALATVFRPDLTWRIDSKLRLFYQAELGLNFWGQHNPDQEAYGAPDAFVLKHRQVYGEGELGDFGFKAGYAELQDATGLFIHHWIGAAEARWALSPSSRVSVLMGLVPNQIYEGIDIEDNNFDRSSFAYAISWQGALGDGMKLNLGVHNLFDSHVVGQVLRVWCPNAELEVKSGAVSATLDVAVQAGRFTGTALGGGSQSHFAWAVQGRLQADLSMLELQLNAFALSADDDFDGNGTSGAFLYSGKSRSSTLALTEDDIRNWYDGLDVRMSSFRDGFYTNRAGLAVADVKATLKVSEEFRPALIVGAASTLNPHNSLGSSFVGIEVDLLLQYRLSEHLLAQAAVGAVLPGQAGGALSNRIDLGKTDHLIVSEASLLMHY